MSDIRKFLVTGNVGKVDVTQTNSGTLVFKFSVGSGTNKKGDDGKYITEWYNCTSFGSAGERLAKIVKVGARVMVEGHYEPRIYISKKTGEPCLSRDVIIPDRGGDVSVLIFAKDKDDGLPFGGRGKSLPPASHDSGSLDDLDGEAPF